MDHLAGIDEHRVREAFIEGFAPLRKRLGRSTFKYDEALGAVATVLLGEKSPAAFAAWSGGHLMFKGNPDGSVQEVPDNRKLLAAIWRLVGEGVVVPRLKQERDQCVFLYLSLTEKGERIVSKADEHPLHPGFITRFQVAAPTAINPVVAHLEDAVSCLEAGLLRPALMMLGLANELTVRITHNALVHQGKLKAAGPRAKTRDLLADVQSVAETWSGGKGGSLKDEEHRLTSATSASEVIRDERNQAAHPGKKVTDGPHVERLMILGAHHMPVFWELIVKPAVAAGFVL